MTDTSSQGNSTEKTKKPIEFKLNKKYEDKNKILHIDGMDLTGPKVLENPVYYIQKYGVEHMFDLTAKEVEEVMKMDAREYAKKGK